ncbi:MAG: hypothetical protein ACKO5M_12245 [Vulcanococcus sp.]
MPPTPRLSWSEDPLALDPGWASADPGLSLVPLQDALEQTVFRSGLSRDAWLRRLAEQLHQPHLLPLLWLLPRGWRLSPAQLPPKLQSLAAVLEEGLLSPSLLAALVDDLPHLLPPANRAITALTLWSRTALLEGNLERPIPATSAALDALLRECRRDELPEEEARAPLAPRTPQPQGDTLLGGLIWRNAGLPYSQASAQRRLNALLAQLLNRLAANRLDGEEPWSFEACSSGRQWLGWLENRGWRIRARLRASVASFGLGASLPREGSSRNGWSQVPLGLPLRTGLLDDGGEEALALLPHTALELRLEHDEGDDVRLQHYQGTEGLCGWEGLNDLHRPWQNDAANGTVRYVGEPFSGERLLELIDLTEVMALIHNQLASALALRYGGYGSLGFCIDTTALLDQAMNQRCRLFPLLLSGIWRERLLRQSRTLPASAALERYRGALQALPLDLSHHGRDCAEAWQRLRGRQPENSPFLLVQRHQSTGASAPP